MAKIKSSVEVAKEAVKPLLDLELPKFEKIELEHSNIDGLVKGAKINNELGELMAEYEKAVKNFAHQVVALAEKKEQDDKKDALSFSSAIAKGSSRQSSRKETVKARLTKKTDWQKYGREHLESAGVYFKQDGSGYVIDGAKAVENIVNAEAEGAIKHVEEKHNTKARMKKYNDSQQLKKATEGPDFDPQP
uniref:hypothetical protein n=1 Tax=Lactococcus garvieae TaxID=1363 RepID=UPI00359C60FE